MEGEVRLKMDLEEPVLLGLVESIVVVVVVCF
jgi:hypothetical protein